jgi:hypothetical protein
MGERRKESSVNYRKLELVGVLLLTAGLFGCGPYTIEFRVQDVINAPGDELSRQMLDVDIVCLSPSEAERHPDIASGQMRSDVWFKARRGDGVSISDIPADQVYSFRGLREHDQMYVNYTSDTRKRGPLVPVLDGGERVVTVDVEHPTPGKKDSVLLIFGRFHDGRGGLLPTDAVRISPSPKAESKITVDVGKRNLTLISAE